MLGNEYCRTFPFYVLLYGLHTFSANDWVNSIRILSTNIVCRSRKSTMLTTTQKNHQPNYMNNITANICQNTRWYGKQRYREQVFRKITAIVDATICYNESLNSWLVFDTWVMKTGVQHDDREWQYIARVCAHTHTLTGAFIRNCFVMCAVLPLLIPLLD